MILKIALPVAKDYWRSFQEIPLFSSYETYFRISGCVNKLNMRYWPVTNPRELHVKLLHSHKVRCAIFADNVIDPFYFENNYGLPSSSPNDSDYFQEEQI